MNLIPDSELILNADGSIYHLNLRPEDIAPLIILVGDPGRVERISQRFDHVELRKSNREFVTHTGRLGSKRLTVLSTGIGTENIDIVLNELDALVNIDFSTRTIKPVHTSLDLIRAGTSGALHAGLAPGDLVSTRYALGFDNLFYFYSYIPNLGEATLADELATFSEYTAEFPVRPFISEGNRDLLATVGSTMQQGITITAPGFYGPQGRELRLSSRLSPSLIRSLAHFSFHGIPVLNFEMETSAIYGLSRLLGHRALTCNVILANRITGVLTGDHAGIEARLIEEVLQGIDRLS